MRAPEPLTSLPLGLPLAAIMYGLIVLFMFTYWPLVGLWT